MSRRRFFGAVALAGASATALPAILKGAGGSTPVVPLRAKAFIFGEKVWVKPKSFYASITIPEHVITAQRNLNRAMSEHLKFVQSMNPYMEEYREPRRVRPTSDDGC